MAEADNLIKYAKQVLKNKQFIVAIQREPYLHIHTQEGIRLQKAAGGAHVLLDDILKQTGGLMVALAAGDADRETVDEKGRIEVPPKEKKYTLKRIFLNKTERDGFYYGFANQTLWPLCHVVFIKPIFSQKWWEAYTAVNQKYAETILEEIGDKEAFVWINDYHLALLAKFLKERSNKITVGTFWHIPWPTYEIFRICPWRKSLLEGLLGSDFVGFHRGYHVENFVECCRRELEVITDTEPRSVDFRNHTTRLANIPAGIDYAEIREKLAKITPVDKNLIQKDFGFSSELLIIGVDRIDYTKGLVERLKIIDRFFEKYPEFKEKLTYLSIGAPSRTQIPAYKALNTEIDMFVKKINEKYKTKKWKPIQFIKKMIPRERIFKYYNFADVCLVTSLDDGMNLVAKEYIISCQEDKGVLLLSKFTGAAKDLSNALLINPYDTNNSADTLYKGLTMSKSEKIERNKIMRKTLKEHDTYHWAIKFIEKTFNKLEYAP